MAVGAVAALVQEAAGAAGAALVQEEAAAVAVLALGAAAQAVPEQVLLQVGVRPRGALARERVAPQAAGKVSKPTTPEPTRGPMTSAVPA